MGGVVQCSTFEINLKCKIDDINVISGMKVFSNRRALLFGMSEFQFHQHHQLQSNPPPPFSYWRSYVSTIDRRVEQRDCVDSPEWKYFFSVLFPPGCCPHVLVMNGSGGRPLCIIRVSRVAIGHKHFYLCLSTTEILCSVQYNTRMSIKWLHVEGSCPGLHHGGVPAHV